MTKNKLFEFDKKFSTCPPHKGINSTSQPLNSSTNLLTLHSSRFTLIGTDEAGRGPGAGGVFASAVYFPSPDKELIKKLAFLNDSKKLSKKKREELYDIILENSINSTVCIEVEEIEKINILNASLKAMGLAVENVTEQMQRGKDAKMHSILILVDGNKSIKTDYRLPITVYPIVKGDAQSASIAAASILAKVSRDRYMTELHEKFPQYNWKQNAGYLTAEHLRAIDKYGLTPCHRKSFLRKQKAKQLSLLN